jgi:hypothetical protein
MRLLTATVSPFTGFGDDPNWSIKFRLKRLNGQFAQWQSPPRRTLLRIHHSNDTVRQRHGRDPWTVTWRLAFDHQGDWERLDALVDHAATLRYRAGLTPNLDGQVEALGGVQYLVLPNTTLDDLTDPVMDIGGGYEARATFSRTYVAPTFPEPPPWPAPPHPIPHPYGFGDWFFGDEPFGEGFPGKGE